MPCNGADWSVCPLLAGHSHTQEWTHKSFLVGLTHAPVSDSRVDMNVIHMVVEEGHLDSPETQNNGILIRKRDSIIQERVRESIWIHKNYSYCNL